jgi:starch synthase (maltosyl-transferring)
MTENRDNFVLIAVNLDPRQTRACTFELPLWEFGLPDGGALHIEDLFSGGSWQWRGKLQQLRLDPAVNPAAIWRLSLPAA